MPSELASHAEKATGALAAQMVLVPAGTIALRDDRTGRSWSVALPSFAIGRFPVTQAQYAALTGAASVDVAASGEVVQPQDTAQCPMTNVSWLDAVRFCNLLSRAAGLPDAYLLHEDEDKDQAGASLLAESDGYRLPAEAEWEYACRAGSNRPRYGKLDDIAWYRDNAEGRAHAVGQKQANAWGLHDMLGNVWEWCADLYDPQVYGPYRVFRGGGWADAERGCLATNRRRSHPTFAIDDLGFRLARSLPVADAPR